MMPSIVEYLWLAVDMVFFLFDGFAIVSRELQLGRRLGSLFGLEGASDPVDVFDAEVRAQLTPDTHKGSWAVVTGANSGIGEEIAKELLLTGYNVVLACRSPERGRAAEHRLQPYATFGNKVEFRQCDLSSLASVRRFADGVRELSIQLLVNNAGVMTTPLAFTKDGYELQFATNHLGHFLLTLLLVDTLKRNSPARIVNVTSEAHHSSASPITEEMARGVNYSRFAAYSRSKLCNIQFTYELDRRLRAKGETQISVLAAHPGCVGTNITAQLPPVLKEGGAAFFKLFGRSIPSGAATPLYCCLADIPGISSRYFVDCRATASHPDSYNLEHGNQLWDLSLRGVAEHLPEHLHQL